MMVLNPNGFPLLMPAIYAHRAGIEGTISQAVRTCEVRRSRYRGLPKTALQLLLTATALNLVRMGM
jgi:IS5 family transposase